MKKMFLLLFVVSTVLCVAGNASTIELPKKDNIIAHWSLDGDAIDISGNENDGAPNNVTYSDDAKKGNKSAVFSGLEDDESLISLPTDIGEEDIKTICFWVKRYGNNNTTNYTYVIRKGDKLHIRILDSGVLKFVAGDLGVDGTVTDSVWVHVAAVIDEDGVKLYMDGELKGSDSGTTGLESTDGYFGLASGFNSGWATLNGQMDDVILWDVALDSAEIQDVINCTSIATNMDNKGNNNLVPNSFIVGNYPNPFNPSTTISYKLPEAGDVNIQIYDVTGALVTELVNATKSAGSYSVKWNGKTALGIQATSGVYIYRVQYNGKIKTAKMILMK